jgi:hypothetical protein
MRHGLLTLAVAVALLTGCGQGSGNKAAPAANNSATSNAAAPAPVNTANATTPAPAGAGIPARPVRVGMGGAERGVDACPSSGRLIGQNPIAIREAPAPGARESAQGQLGMAVHICEAVDGWQGIVWSPTTPDDNCGVGTNLPAEKDYDGPCRSGWVPASTVEITAG